MGWCCHSSESDSAVGWLPASCAGFLQLVVSNDPHARALLGDVADNCSGKLTVNVSGLVINAQGDRIDLDIRIPVAESSLSRF